MMGKRYWFARRFPVGDAKANMVAPVTTEGWVVVSFLGACLLAGAGGLVTMSFTYHAPLAGLVLLIGFPLVGIATFVICALRKGDQQHTVDDYKLGRVPNG